MTFMICQCSLLSWFPFRNGCATWCLYTWDVHFIHVQPDRRCSTSGLNLDEEVKYKKKKPQSEDPAVTPLNRSILHPRDPPQFPPPLLCLLLVLPHFLPHFSQHTHSSANPSRQTHSRLSMCEIEDFLIHIPSLFGTHTHACTDTHAHIHTGRVKEKERKNSPSCEQKQKVATKKFTCLTFFYELNI